MNNLVRLILLQQCVVELPLCSQSYLSDTIIDRLYCMESSSSTWSQLEYFVSDKHICQTWNLNSTIQLFKLNSWTFQVFKFSTIQLFKFSSFQLFNYSSFQVFNYSTIQVFKYSSWIVELFKFSSFQVFNYSTIQLYKFSSIQVE